jgi:hypothetical protein
VVKRGFWSTLLIVASLAITTTTNVGLAAFNGSCVLTPFVVFLTIATTGTFSIERCMFIYSTYISTLAISQAAKKEFGISVEANSTMMSSESGAEDREWFAKNRKKFNTDLFSWTKGTALLLALLVWIPQCIIFVMYFPEATQARFYESQCQVATFWGWIISCLFLSFPACFFVWIGLKFRKIRENFYILREMQYLMFVAMAVGLPFVSFFVPQLGRTIFVIWLSITGQVGMWISSCSFQFFRKDIKNSNMASISSNEQRSQVQLSENVQILREILEDSGIRWHSFESFLIKEFSIENALLWKAIESLKKDEGKKFEQKATRIFQQFISVDGEYSVNISSRCRNDVERFFQSGALSGDSFTTQCVELFNAVQKEIFQLILTDSFPRFKVLNKKMLDSVEPTTPRAVPV